MSAGAADLKAPPRDLLVLLTACGSPGLLTGGLPQFLATGTLPQAAPCMAAGFQQSERKRAPWKPWSFYNRISEVTHTFLTGSPHSVCGKRVTWSSPHSKGGITQEHEDQGAGTMETLQQLPTPLLSSEPRILTCR